MWTPWPISVQQWRTSTCAVGPEPHHGPGDLLEPVAQARVLEPEAQARPPCRRPGPPGSAARSRRGSARPAEAAVVHDLTRAPHLRRGGSTLRLPHLQPVMPTWLGQPVDHPLHGELGLVGPEAPEGAAHRVVGAHGQCLARRSRARGRARWRGRPPAPAPSCRPRRRARNRRPSGACMAVRRPSASHPAHVLHAGWDGAWGGCRSDCSRVRVHFTGRPAGARRPGPSGPGWPCPPCPRRRRRCDTSSTVTRPGRRPGCAAIWLRSSHTPWPPEHTCSVPSGRGSASVDSGSRKACSMRWVWNTSCTTWALAARAASTSPPRVYAERATACCRRAPHRVLGGGQGRQRDR